MRLMAVLLVFCVSKMQNRHCCCVVYVVRSDRHLLNATNHQLRQNPGPTMVPMVMIFTSHLIFHLTLHFQRVALRHG
uniref:Putative secreted protein n=1 Tax=Anopheles darlingi TaxID=43151 RepID=A0A2M4DEE1_ANODA